MAYGYSPSIDITALILEPEGELPPDFAWHIPRLNALPPSIGDCITAFGYPNSKHRVVSDGTARIRLDPRTAPGDVLDVHYNYRDRAVLPFPCCHTNARYDGGMSGGPVFNAAGQVCGLVSTNIPPETPDEEHSSYVSRLWPVLGLGLTVDVTPPRDVRQRYHFKHLADTGAMQMLNAECVSVTEEDGQDHLHFTPPNRPPE